VCDFGEICQRALAATVVVGTVEKIKKEGNQCIGSHRSKRVMESDVVCILESNGHQSKYRSENMKSLYNRYVLVTAILASIALGYKPAEAVPVDGDSEAQVSGGFSHSQGSHTGTFNADLSYGYYLTPGWEIGLRQAVNYNFINKAPDAWQAVTTPFVWYNFKVNNVLVPYLGISGGIVWNDRDITGVFGPNAGAKLFVTDQTFLNIGYRYEWFFKNFEAARDNRTHGNHVVNIGFGLVSGGSGDRKTTN
jgi:hypothetical protein